MVYEPCNWYKSTKHQSPLDNFIEDRSLDLPYTYCEKDVQIMVVNYIQCVKLDDIEKREPWALGRVEAIKKWATPEKLRRLKYLQEEETNKKVIPPGAFHDMPMLSREYKLGNNEKTTKPIIQEKFKISDGIHRINRARELGIDCILATVEEHVKINMTDIKNIEVKVK